MSNDLWYPTLYNSKGDLDQQALIEAVETLFTSMYKQSGKLRAMEQVALQSAVQPISYATRANRVNVVTSTITVPTAPTQFENPETSTSPVAIPTPINTPNGNVLATTPISHPQLPPGTLLWPVVNSTAGTPSTEMRFENVQPGTYIVETQGYWDEENSRWVIGPKP